MRPSEPKYTAIKTAYKSDHDVIMEANPAYRATS